TTPANTGGTNSTSTTGRPVIFRRGKDEIFASASNFFTSSYFEAELGYAFHFKNPHLAAKAFAGYTYFKKDFSSDGLINGTGEATSDTIEQSFNTVIGGIGMQY